MELDVILNQIEKGYPEFALGMASNPRVEAETEEAAAWAAYVAEELREERAEFERNHAYWLHDSEAKYIAVGK